MNQQQHRHHFLVITFPAQGHINPAHHLARRLTRFTGADVTFSTAISAHRRMFSSSAAVDHQNGLVRYAPFSDGYDDGFDPKTSSTELYMSSAKLLGSQSLSRLAQESAASNRPVTCIIYTILLSWAADVASGLGIPSALFWIQPAGVYNIYYRYFHGYSDLISSHKDDPSFTIHLPGLQPLHIHDLPDLVTLSGNVNDFYTSILAAFQQLFETQDRMISLGSKGSKPIVLVNTFDALEPGALSAVDEVEMKAVGPMVDVSLTDQKGNDIFEEDSRGYMEWLNSKQEGSVIYVAFGSFSELSKRQIEEISVGLEGSGRPYLWVIRGNSSDRGGGEMGMVVEWCSQVKVLSHSSIGCFVTHCGWNSMTESLVCGVPMLMVPQWSDQPTNAKLAEEWGAGMRCKVDGDGVLEGEELRRCLDVVLGEEGAEIRRRAAMWRDKAMEAMGEGGSSVLNLKTSAKKFGESISN